LSLTGPHDEFLELCAVSTSGQLREAEQRRLGEHLATCPSCREALKQFEAVVDQAAAMGATELAESLKPGPSWSQEQAEKDFWDRLAREENVQAGKGENPNANLRRPASRLTICQRLDLARCVGARRRRDSAFCHSQFLRLSGWGKPRDR
jgi:anti-sigma factor ChrR (cupin superfamily)